jgi:hypothetical protein
MRNNLPEPTGEAEETFQQKSILFVSVEKLKRKI